MGNTAHPCELRVAVVYAPTAMMAAGPRDTSPARPKSHSWLTVTMA